MRKFIFVLAGLGVATVVIMALATRPGWPSGNTTAKAEAESTEATASSNHIGAMAQGVSTRQRGGDSNETPSRLAGDPENIKFAAEIDTLVSPHATYAEKQAAWKELLASGRIQDAIAELTQRAANDPQNAAIAAALGQAYLKACGTTQDVHDQAIWAMQADRSFDAALNLDPQNWDARFTKAVAMSYWPENLNKGQEVIDQFNTLIQQQEKEAPQPQFAQTYDWLGQQYAKAGQQDMATQVWQRGASLFPDSTALQGRLAAGQTQ